MGLAIGLGETRWPLVLITVEDKGVRGDRSGTFSFRISPFEV
jgi:hypothetical protein